MCGVFEISSYISKAGFNNTQHVELKTFEVIPKFESGESINDIALMKTLINPTSGNIILSIYLSKNIWSVCSNTSMKIVVVKEICDSSRNITIDYLPSIDLKKYPLNTLIDIDLDNGMNRVILNDLNLL